MGKFRRHYKGKDRKTLLRTLVKKHRGSCALCGEQVVLVEGHVHQATIDHVVPVSKGGLDLISNMQLACRVCNERKGSRNV